VKSHECAIHRVEAARNPIQMGNSAENLLILNPDFLNFLGAIPQKGTHSRAYLFGCVLRHFWLRKSLAALARRPFVLRGASPKETWGGTFSCLGGLEFRTRRVQFPRGRCPSNASSTQSQSPRNKRTILFQQIGPDTAPISSPTRSKKFAEQAPKNLK